MARNIIKPTRNDDRFVTLRITLCKRCNAFTLASHHSRHAFRKRHAKLCWNEKESNADRIALFGN